MKSALILGADGALGREIINELLKNEFTIVGTTKGIQKNSAPHVEYMELDMSDKGKIDSVVEKIKDKKFDVFTSTIANSLSFNKFELIDNKKFEEDITINILNHIYAIRKIIPLMNKNSNIVFILTIYVDGIAPKYCSSYVASKYYLLGLMKVLSEELKAKEIRVNGLSPGMMDTAFIKNTPDLVKKIYLKEKNKAELLKPNDVAKVFVKIIQDESLNGQNIIVE